VEIAEGNLRDLRAGEPRSFHQNSDIAEFNGKFTDSASRCSPPQDNPTVALSLKFVPVLRVTT
jgi:hypothetical protein